MRPTYKAAVLAGLFLAAGTLAAQKTTPAKEGAKAGAGLPSAAEQKLTVAEKLMAEYRFEEAAAQLEKDIAAAQKKKQATASLEEMLETAHQGMNMLRGTEKVVFIDSVVVKKSEILSAIHLTPENGTLGYLDELFAQNGISISSSGQTAFMNELKDQVFFSLPGSNGEQKLATANRLIGGWDEATPLEGISERDEKQDYPFVMADGMTVYYAAQGDESLGGYDIFVTRYNPNTKQYVKPENIGMPFNSPANDYLYVVDELNKIGWFVTDRGQAPGNVCVYAFIPNSSREVYDSSQSQDEVRLAAKIHSIKSSQGDKKAVAEALGRLKAVQSDTRSLSGGAGNLWIVINDHLVYTNLNQFHSSAAKRMAQQWIQAKESLAQKKENLSNLRQQYARNGANPTVAANIFSLEREVEEVESYLQVLEKNMRKAELN